MRVAFCTLDNRRCQLVSVQIYCVIIKTISVTLLLLYPGLGLAPSEYKQWRSWGVLVIALYVHCMYTTAVYYCLYVRGCTGCFIMHNVHGRLYTCMCACKHAHRLSFHPLSVDGVSAASPSSSSIVESAEMRPLIFY